MPMVQEFKTLPQDANEQVPSRQHLDSEIVALAWRRKLETAEHAALSPKRRAPKVDIVEAAARRVETLQREVSRLRHKLSHAERIIAVQKQLCDRSADFVIE